MTIDVRTPIERARDERNKLICDNFLRMSNEMPGVAPHRIMRLIAEKVGMTVPGVKSVIVAQGLYRCPQRKTL